MRNFFVNFKRLWNDPRWHAIIILGCYVLFFGIIFAYINLASNVSDESPTYVTDLDKLNQMNDYDYVLEIDDEVIEGHILNDTNTFIFENEEYIYTNDEKLEFKYQELIRYTNTKTVYELIKDMDEDSKTEYKDGRISKMYQLEDLKITMTLYKGKIDNIEFESDDHWFKVSYSYDL